MVGLVGPRGVGKTTMVLQRIKENNFGKSLYVAADDSYFATSSLIKLAGECVKNGDERLFIDEIHKYEGCNNIVPLSMFGMWY